MHGWINVVVLQMFSLSVSHTHECKYDSCSLQVRPRLSCLIPICLPHYLVSMSVYVKINVVSVCLYVLKTHAPVCVCVL